MFASPNNMARYLMKYAYYIYGQIATSDKNISLLSHRNKCKISIKETMSFRYICLYGQSIYIVDLETAIIP